MAGDIYEAVNSFSVEFEGFPVVVRKGSTVREGHQLLADYPSLFKLLVPTYEHVEPEPEPEPEPAPVAPPAPKAPAVKAAPKPVVTKAKVDDKE